MVNDRPFYISKYNFDIPIDVQSASDILNCVDILPCRFYRMNDSDNYDKCTIGPP